ncbi:DUF3846 domain-containing protein [Kitasatospora sp. NPDC088548]|uniref:DUF3846 domain-containing protein n=1 Tax=Kitasatospora sp. NPDC088548 TaxID=3364075 RepID=UPI003819B651
MSAPAAPARPALLITTDGDVSVIDLPEPDALSVSRLLECHRADVVRLTPAMDMWIDDEGYGVEPVNRPATALARRFGFIYQQYHGPALLAGYDDQGETVPLTPDTLDALRRTLASMPGTTLR